MPPGTHLLAAKLALHQILELAQAAGRQSREVVLLWRDLILRWPQTGFSADDLHAAIARGLLDGDFRLVACEGGHGLTVGRFELRGLDPQTLDEIEALAAAFRELEQRRPGVPDDPTSMH